MGKPNANFVHILSGKTFLGNCYQLKISVKDNEIDGIEISKHANLHVKELAEYLCNRKTKSITDVIELVKLKMIEYNQYVSEKRI